MPNRRRVRLCELTRTLPRLTFATPTVAGAPLAVFGDAGGALALLPPPPQPASATTVRGSVARVARKVIGLLRVMLAPFVLGRAISRSSWLTSASAHGRGRAVRCLHRQRPSSLPGSRKQMTPAPPKRAWVLAAKTPRAQPGNLGGVCFHLPPDVSPTTRTRPAFPTACMRISSSSCPRRRERRLVSGSSAPPLPPRSRPTA